MLAKKLSYSYLLQACFKIVINDWDYEEDFIGDSFQLFCMLAVLTACSDDDDNTDSAKIAGTFAGGTLGLHEGGSSWLWPTNLWKWVQPLMAGLPSYSTTSFQMLRVYRSKPRWPVRHQCDFFRFIVVNNCTVGITGTYASNYLDVDVAVLSTVLKWALGRWPLRR